MRTGRWCISQKPESPNPDAEQVDPTGLTAVRQAEGSTCFTSYNYHFNVYRNSEGIHYGPLHSDGETTVCTGPVDIGFTPPAGGGGDGAPPAAGIDIVVVGARVAWCVVSALDIDIIPGLSPNQINDVADGLATLSLPILTKREVTGRRGVMRNAAGQMNPSGGMTSPLSVLSRRMLGRNLGRTIGRAGGRILPVAAVAIRAQSIYEGIDDVGQCF